MRRSFAITLVVFVLLIACLGLWGLFRRNHSSAQIETNPVSELGVAGKHLSAASVNYALAKSNTSSNFEMLSEKQNEQLNKMGIFPGMTKDELVKSVSDYQIKNGGVRVEEIRKPIGA